MLTDKEKYEQVMFNKIRTLKSELKNAELKVREISSKLYMAETSMQIYFDKIEKEKKETK